MTRLFVGQPRLQRVCQQVHLQVVQVVTHTILDYVMIWLSFFLLQFWCEFGDPAVRSHQSWSLISVITVITAITISLNSPWQWGWRWWTHLGSRDHHHRVWDWQRKTRQGIPVCSSLITPYLKLVWKIYEKMCIANIFHLPPYIP